LHQWIQKIIIIKPSSYLLSDEEETTGKTLQNDNTKELPNLWIFFNCKKQVGTIGMNWLCYSKETILATMEINYRCEATTMELAPRKNEFYKK
jgi:hypothetical protein